MIAVIGVVVWPLVALAAIAGILYTYLSGRERGEEFTTLRLALEAQLATAYADTARLARRVDALEADAAKSRLREGLAVRR